MYLIIDFFLEENYLTSLNGPEGKQQIKKH